MKRNIADEYAVNPATANPTASPPTRVERISHSRLMSALRTFEERIAEHPAAVTVDEVRRAHQLASAAVASQGLFSQVFFRGWPYLMVLSALVVAGAIVAGVAFGAWVQGLGAVAAFTAMSALLCCIGMRALERTSLGHEVLWHTLQVASSDECVRATEHAAEVSSAARAVRDQVLTRGEALRMFHMTAMCELAQVARP